MIRRPSPIVPLALLLAGVIAACSEAETGPNTPVAISFDSLPSPAIVIGDTLRDSTGAVAPLHATVYNGDGDPIVDAPVRWFVLTRDTLNRPTGDTVVLAVDSVTGLAFAPTPSSDAVLYARRNVSAVVVPQIGRLPGPSRQVQLTLRPDTLTAPASIDTAGPSRVITDTAARSSQPVTARVLHDSAGLGATLLGVRGWVVRYGIEYHGAPIPEGSRAFWMVNDSYRRSTRDTTDASGNAARRVAIDPDSLAIAATGGVDSLTVVVEARYRGELLPGAPARVTVPIRIQPPPAAATP